MKLSRAQKKAEMEKAAAVMIESLLDWDEENKAPNLREIEDELLQLRKQFGQVFATRVLEHQEASQPIEYPVCPQCGEGMRYKGKKRTTVESRLGELAIARGYCPQPPLAPAIGHPCTLCLQLERRYTTSSAGMVPLEWRADCAGWSAHGAQDEGS